MVQIYLFLIQDFPRGRRRERSESPKKGKEGECSRGLPHGTDFCRHVLLGFRCASGSCGLKAALARLPKEAGKECKSFCRAAPPLHRVFSPMGREERCGRASSPGTWCWEQRARGLLFLQEGIPHSSSLTRLRSGDYLLLMLFIGFRTTPHLEALQASPSCPLCPIPVRPAGFCVNFLIQGQIPTSEVSWSCRYRW